MNSKGKRSSILKKQQQLPSTDGRVSPVASLPSAQFKSSRKIEFHRKKSIKEFLVGEDVDTIWGNSYEVSTDGTPSSGFEDATLANSSCRSTTDEQNKENQPSSVDNSVRRNSINTTNTSWDLSITIADEEKRKIRSETSAVFSQSLNTTERLLVEPFGTPQVPTDKVKLTLNGLHGDINDVQAMDISPIKSNINPSPRKLIYTFPKQGMFVEINDVPEGNLAEQNVEDASLSAHQRENPVRPSWRAGSSATGSQSALLGGSSYNVSETWNSHPQAMFRQGGHTRVSGDLGNVSSDVDTTIALTNAMTKVLQSRSNESIQKATNMELDESTTTLPTNALARARPSFLPSNQRPVDESQDVLEQTPTNVKQTRATFISAGYTCEDTQSADISSPVEGHVQRDSLSLDNLSILTDMKQTEANEENTNKIGFVQQQFEVDKSSAECKREGIPIDFGLSSLSLNLLPSSPEVPAVVKPRILRPTLPLSMLEAAKDVDESKKTDTKDEYDRNRSVKRTLGMVSSQREKASCENLKETEVATKKSLVAMDISTRRHTNKPSLTTVHSRTTVDMVESPAQSKKDYRSQTIYQSHDIDIDRGMLQGQNSSKQRHRGTVLCDEEMELTTHVSAVVKSSTNATRRTDHVPEPVQDETTQIQHTSDRMKRGTVLGTVPIDDSTDCSPHSPETALKNYRKTLYPLDRMKEDVSVVPPTKDSDRKTIIGDESMVLDVYPATCVKAGSDSSISCVVYGRNVDELSIHATHGNNAVDMKFAHPTICQPEPCDESAQIVSGRQTLMQEENMVLSAGAVSAKGRRQRFTTHIAHSMEEDEKSTVNQKKNDTTPSLHPSRKSIFNAEEMELTLVQKSNTMALPEPFEKHADQECMDLHKTHREDGKAHFIQSHPQSRIPRLTTHVREDMQDIQREQSRPRHSIYEREDMDVTKLDGATAINETYPDDRSSAKLQESKEKNSTIHATNQHKSRSSIYEHEAMNATNICEDQRVESHCPIADQEPIWMQNEDRTIAACETHSKSARIGFTDMEIEQPVIQTEPKESTYRKDVTTFTHIGCADVVGEMQHDVTNYNTFLEHHESSHGTQVQRASAAHHTDQLQLGKTFNSTRLSKAYENDSVSKSVIPSRLSSYQIEAMDETNTPDHTSTSNARQTNFSERKTFSNARFDSPMHMSPVGGNSGGKSTLGQYSRQTSYYPEEMESAPTAGQKKAVADRKTCIESFSFRQSELQRIALQSNAIDMEGISVLESDPTDSKLEKYVTVQGQATNYFPSCTSNEVEGNMMHSVVGTMEMQPKGLPNNRLSVYDAAAMVEETVPINTLRLKQGHSSALERPDGVTSKERKSNNCMDETIVPENIRVERDAKYDIHQSGSRVDSTVNASPVVCIAEHPPIMGQHQPNGRGTLYGTEETMELGTAMSKLTKSLQDKRNRQTIHQPANMDLTTVGREIATPPPPQVFSQRETIYNVRAMEETPPHGGFNSVKATNANKPSPSEPGQQSVIAERPSQRGQRQTILIPQDMDVEEGEQEQADEEQQSFAFSMLPRESTEDRVPRSASILPRHAFFRDPSMDAFPEITKSGPKMERQSLQTFHRKIIPVNDTSAFKTHEISDISLATTTMEPEVPGIGNITGMMSMREITEPLSLASLQEQSNSVSVICRADGPRNGPVFDKEQKDLHDHTVSVEAMAFVPTRQTGASDDEFYDAEDDPAVEHDHDPLSLTKSRHLTMKFIDVGHLEQTNYNTTVPVLGPVTACKRAHAQVLSSPVINRATEADQDPLQMTTERQTLHVNMEHTPQGPNRKRPRTSCTIPAPEDISTEVAAAAAVEEPSPIEEVIVKEERESLIKANRISQTIIHDPSVFVMEEQDLLDDESDLPCTSMTEELQPDSYEQPSPKQSTTPPPSSTSQPPVCMITELSYYKNFANLTIDSYEEERLTPSPGDVGELEGQEDAPQVDGLVAECISLSDEDSLNVTPPKVPLSLDYKGGNQQTDEVLDSTIASKIMYQIRQTHPVVKHSCCGMQTECLCRMWKDLKRHQEMSDLVWNRWCTKYEAIKQRIPKVSHEEQQTDPQQRDEEHRSDRVTLEEQIEELNWRLLRAKVDDDYLFVKGELSREDLSRRRSRTIVSGHYPETPSAVFLVDNFRSYLSEQLYVDNSPPSGADRPRVPRMTQLIANKLSTDTGTRWLLDCSEDGDGVLLLRHRTLRSFFISIQLQPPRSKPGKMVREITESWRLERIQVCECMEEYVHSPKLLLAHVEFMRLAQETTERTLRSTYRTVADLMGLWHHFHELIVRVFDAVNRLVTIIRNNDALLCYDAQMERFHVKKCVYRALDDEVNTLLVHFNWIASIGASGVSFKWPTAELNTLLPTSTGANQHTTAPGSFMQSVGTNEKAGLMFLECLLWNVAKHYET
ncbi:uncharacterized protein LOC128310743 [Anopheles moucheti]|uniref:uncharacterized protein LOC128310743 n=1 Tax=Anopheles moucheti TaxID=186751 RepID=UPI0022F0C5AE|nr:uncharacterized protein LOC128310743 [Anopheles moucheti]